MPTQLLCLFVALLTLFPRLSPSQTLVQTGRYTAVYAIPTDAQREPLQAIVTIEFPDDVQTVGQAVHALLADTGYGLTDVLNWDIEVFPLLNHSIPRVQRELGPLTVHDAIKTLVGPAFEVVVDPVRREIAFMLRPQAPFPEADVAPPAGPKRK